MKRVNHTELQYELESRRVKACGEGHLKDLNSIEHITYLKRNNKKIEMNTRRYTERGKRRVLALDREVLQL